MSLKLVEAAAETANLFPNGNEFFIYEDSPKSAASFDAMMARDGKERFLLLTAKENAGDFASFEGETVSGNGFFAKNVAVKTQCKRSRFDDLIKQKERKHKSHR